MGTNWKRAGTLARFQNFFQEAAYRQFVAGTQVPEK